MEMSLKSHLLISFFGFMIFFIPPLIVSMIFFPIGVIFFLFWMWYLCKYKSEWLNRKYDKLKEL